MKIQALDGLLTATAAFLAAAFTRNELVAVLAMSIAGAGIGGTIATLLSHVFTGPGLGTMKHAVRWLVNFLCGVPTGFFSAYEVQSRWMPGYPVEFVGCLMGFLGGVLMVSLICILIPRIMEWAKNARLPFSPKAKE